MDNKKMDPAPNGELISVHEEYELQGWSEKFGVTKERLKTAIKAVGNSVKSVEAFLKKKQ